MSGQTAADVSPCDNTPLLLEAVADFFEEDPKRWTQGQLAKNSAGELVDPSSTDAVSWCVLGAADKFCSSHAGLRHEVYDALVRATGAIFVASDWNDDDGRTVDDVIAACRKAAQQERERISYVEMEDHL